MGEEEEEEGEGDETYNIFDSSSQNDDLRNDKLQLQFNIDFCQNLFPSFIFEYSKPNIIQFKILVQFYLNQFNMLTISIKIQLYATF